MTHEEREAAQTEAFKVGLGHTHTKGPWTLKTVKTVCGLCHKIGPFPSNRLGQETHACLYVDYPAGAEFNKNEAEVLANANLITAAPDLLAALEATKYAIQCAITLRSTFGGNVGGGVDIFKEAESKLEAAIAKARGGQS